MACRLCKVDLSHYYQIYEFWLEAQTVAAESFDSTFVIGVSKLILKMGGSQKKRKRQPKWCLFTKEQRLHFVFINQITLQLTLKSPNSLTNMGRFYNRNRFFHLKMLFKCLFTILSRAFALRLMNSFLQQFLFYSNWHILMMSLVLANFVNFRYV